MNAKFLLNAITNVSIGNGTVYNFIDYIGDIHVTGGILNYTRNAGFLQYNLFNNFNEGMSGRYGYGRGEFLHSDNLESKLYYKVDPNENTVSTTSLAQDRIGEFYSVPIEVGNSSLHTLTESGFLTLGEEIRAEQLSHNIPSGVVEARYGYYNPNAFVASGIPAAPIGSYNVETKLLNNKHLLAPIMRQALGKDTTYKDNAELVNENITKSLGVDNTVYVNYPSTNYDDFKVKLRTPSKHLKSLNDSADSAREMLFQYRITNTMVNDFYGKRFNPGETERYIIDDILRESPVSSGNSSGVIEINKSRIEKNTKRDFGNIPGYWKAAYGITTNDDIVLYSIYDKNTLKNRTTIDESVRGAGLISTSNGSNGKVYTYFDEPDGKSATNIKVKNNYLADDQELMKSSTGYSNLLKKTNELFKDNTIKSLINRFHTETITNPSDFETAYSEYGMSRGRNLLKGTRDLSSGYDNPYCRVWTAHHQYAKLKDRIRPFVDGNSFQDLETLHKGLGPQRPYGAPAHFAANTVLQTNGLVKIAPDNTFNNANGKNLDHYMFSIENLAWRGYTSQLSPVQIGPNGGRIMWFPPYNLKFTENINVQWQDNSFIGRGEKIYTYTNTERSGTLNFTLLMDHPSVLDSWAIQNEKDISNDENELTILRFFAGCAPITLKETEGPEEPQNEIAAEPEDAIKAEDETYKYGFVVFFPNDYSGIDQNKNISELVELLDKYESVDNTFTTSGRDRSYVDEILLDSNINNINSYGLNTHSGFMNSSNFNEIAATLTLDGSITWLSYEDMKTKLPELFSTNSGASTQYVIEKIESYGYASSHGKPKNNQTLAERRRTMICRLANYYCNAINVGDIENSGANVITVEDTDPNRPDVNTLSAKIARSAVIVVSKKLSTEATIPSESTANGTAITGDVLPNNEPLSGNEQTNIISIVENTTEEETTVPEGTETDEYKYFSQLHVTDNLAYQRIVDKIKYFNPAFHSITPEGFNERLNFLHQCTRQGPTDGAVNSGNNLEKTETVKTASNLAFGRAPYCILRIGDFFHTKICIQSISYTFEEGGGIQWDLNPEGAGVQPMMAQVSVNFMFVGGQDIGGVINELQNAVSENYYANSSVYNKRAKMGN